MKERLIELLTDTLKEWKCDVTKETISEIADHLLANGVIVPPCKVGDTVHSFSADFGVVLPYLVESLNIGYMGKSGVYYGYEANCHDPETDELLDEIDFEIDDFGKTVFLTKAESEKALAERREK